MITRKRLLLTLPNGQSLLSYQYNLSDLAGHGSFLFLAFSYMENDFYHLRLYAMSGITLSILFQYYREVPLWIPIRWNSLFLIINAVMIAFLLRDDLAAKNLGEEEQRLYEEVFELKVYYWRFKDLRTLKQHHPSIGLTLERCLSDDLNRKMLTTWSSETKERYKQLLLGATSDGQVADHVKLMLKNVRDRWGISESDHLNLLRGLGWSAAEYNTGFLGVKSLESLHRYETLLKNELADGLTDESRIRLRHFRQMHHLSSAVHVTALRRLGWTLDDYEAGIRTSHIV
eukprot:gene10346-11456_t